jgi:hypothetical protein
MIFVRINKEDIPSNLVESKKNELVVGLGEVTGHAHRVNVADNAGVVSEIVEFAEAGQTETVENDNIYFEVRKGSAIVTHEEHNPAELTEGYWQRVIQTAYDPFTEELTRVRD